MFGKLLKYEFRSMRKILLPVIITALVLSCAVAPLLRNLGKMSTFSALGDVLGMFGVMIIYSLCFVSVILTYILGLIRYRASMFSDRGYLTHTLPVSTHQLLISKILILWGFLTLACLAMVAATIGFIGLEVNTKDFFGFLKENLQYLPGLVLNALALTLVIATIPAFSVSVGHSLRKGRMGLSVALAIGIPYFFFFLLYFLTIFISLLGVENDGFARLLKWVGNNPHAFLAIWLFVQLSLIAFFYFLSWLLTRKKLNLY